jgi:hypothetical protein
MRTGFGQHCGTIAAGAAAVVIDRTDFVQRAVPLIKSAACLPANTAAQKFLVKPFRQAEVRVS